MDDILLYLRMLSMMIGALFSQSAFESDFIRPVRIGSKLNLVSIAGETICRIKSNLSWWVVF